MEQYPSISGSARAPLGKPCIAQYKYDGSNLRFEWNPKRGFHKYGTRRHLFDQTDPVFRESIALFHDTGLASEVVRRTKAFVRNPERITAFAEFFGPNSFAGNHEPSDPKQLKLFDIYLFKKGLLPVKDFQKHYGDLPQAAEVLYEGNLNAQFIMDVKEGRFKPEKLHQPIFEGVIAKGADFSVKIKTKEFFIALFDRMPHLMAEQAE